MFFRPIALIAGSWFSLCGTTQADVLEAVNAVRAQPCAPMRAAGILHAQSRLSDAAARLSRGQGFEAALKSAGYRADRSALILLQGAASDADVQRDLRAKLCVTANDAALTEAGSARRGDRLWLVLAAPFKPPAVRDRGAVEIEILSQVNAARSRGRRCGSSFYPPVATLTLDPILTHAAQVHADNMARLGFLEHQGKDGSTPAQRVRSAGFRNLGGVGENIAGGAMTALEAMQGWLKSPGHCANLMSAEFRAMGVAFAVNESSPLGIYWAQDFARSLD